MSKVKLRENGKIQRYLNVKEEGCLGLEIAANGTAHISARGSVKKLSGILKRKEPEISRVREINLKTGRNVKV